MSPDRNTLIRRASWIAISGNIVLALLKILLGYFSHSRALFSDGIDSTTDIIISTVTLVVAAIIVKPPDKTHPYGHGRAESIATKVVAFLIFFAGAQLALNTVLKILGKSAIETPAHIALYAAVISIFGKVLLSFSQFRIGRRAESPMIIANGKNMLNDIFISLSVLSGLLFVFILKVPVVDSLIAIAVSCWIMKTAVQIFMETNIEVMDGVRDSSLYDKIFESVKRVDGARNPHRTRIRQIGSMYVIDLDIEVDGDLTVSAAHDIALKVEVEIKKAIPNVYDIIVHVEPKGNIEIDERFGVTE
jgi:cation diffusion facilitator family transporter